MLLTFEQKADKLIAIAQQFHLDTFVETGTYEAFTVLRLKDAFKKLYTIELAHDLAEEATTKCAEFPQIEVIEGDSAAKLKDVIDRLEGPALFYLDAHFSGGRTVKGTNGEITVVAAELAAIFNRGGGGAIGDAIVCDDVRDFTIRHSGFELGELLNLIRLNFRAHDFLIVDDQLIIFPTSADFPE